MRHLAISESSHLHRMVTQRRRKIAILIPRSRVGSQLRPGLNPFKAEIRHRKKDRSKEFLLVLSLLIMIVILIQWINIFSASISINSILRKEVKLKKYMKRVFDDIMRTNDN